MISIIVCSTSPVLAKAFTENIRTTIGVPYEIVCIDNSQGQYSICSAYNKGIDRAQYPYLIFLHQDVAFQTTDWGKRMIGHLRQPNTGIIGVAGSQIAHRIPQEAWKGYNRGAHFLQGTPNLKQAPRLYHLPKDYSLPLYPAVCLDGVLLAMNSSLGKNIRFDERIKGFHTYDIDICLQAATAGYLNYVAYDILLTHYSAGNITHDYYQQLLQTYQKWQDRLPVTVPALQNDTVLIHKAEYRQLRKLPKQLLRKGFTIRHIITLITHYSQRIGKPMSQWNILLLRLRLLYQCVYSRLRHKL